MIRRDDRCRGRAGPGVLAPGTHCFIFPRVHARACSSPLNRWPSWGEGGGDGEVGGPGGEARPCFHVSVATPGRLWKGAAVTRGLGPRRPVQPLGRLSQLLSGMAGRRAPSPVRLAAPAGPGSSGERWQVPFCCLSFPVASLSRCFPPTSHRSFTDLFPIPVGSPGHRPCLRAPGGVWPVGHRGGRGRWRPDHTPFTGHTTTARVSHAHVLYFCPARARGPGQWWPGELWGPRAATWKALSPEHPLWVPASPVASP